MKSTTMTITTMKITMKTNCMENNDKPGGQTDDSRNGEEDGGDVECDLENIC